MSVIDICNEALAKNHHMEKIPFDADLANPVGKAQLVCSSVYAQSRRAALRLGPWTCILKRIKLATDTWAAKTTYAAGDMIACGFSVFTCTTAGTSGATAPTWPLAGTIADGSAVWTFAYTTLGKKPDENYTGLSYSAPLPFDYIIEKEVTDTSGKLVHFELERGVLYTDTAEPILIYVPDETDDLLYDPLLREVVVLQVACAIAYPLSGSRENEVAFSQSAQGIAVAAFKKTKQERRQGVPPSEQWIDGIFQERYRP